MFLISYKFLLSLQSLRRSRREFLQPSKRQQIIMLNWLILILAGCMEVAFTFCLGKTKTAAGYELVWWIGFLAALSMSMFLMAKAAERLPIGTVYPVWTGIGAVGAVIVGIIFFNEPATFWRIFFITTLILSIIGLKVLG